MFSRKQITKVRLLSPKGMYICFTIQKLRSLKQLEKEGMTSNACVLIEHFSFIFLFTLNCVSNNEQL